MAKRRGYPDRRGMGAQSDFIAQPFVPGERYKATQLSMARALVATGMDAQRAASLLSVPLDLLQEKSPKARP